MTVVGRNAGVRRWNGSCCYGKHVSALGDLVAETVDHQSRLQCGGGDGSCTTILRGRSWETITIVFSVIKPILITVHHCLK